MATFLEKLLSDASWYAYSIFLAVAIVVNCYLLSHAHGSGFRVLWIVVSYFMAGGMMLLLRSLLRWLKSKKPRDPGRQPGELGSLHFRAAAGKKSK